jgi:nitric oxide reductase NorE protein
VTPVEHRSATRQSGTPTHIPGEEGIWVFVLGDMLVFALFFATFVYSRGRNRDVFAASHQELALAAGAVNTVLLLTSSLLVALGVTRVLTGRHADATRLFVGGLVCGLGFVAVKAIEWGHLFVEGIGIGTGEYFSYFFVLTGVHLGHVFIGLAVLGRLIAISREPELNDKQRRFCETGGVYWHMVDLLWVVLFALFYVLR